MPEKQDRLSNSEPMKSAEQQAQMLVAEAKQRFPIKQEEEYLIVTCAQKYDDPDLARRIIRKLEQAIYNTDPVAVERVLQEAQDQIDRLPDREIGLSEMHEYGYRQDDIWNGQRRIWIRGKIISYLFHTSKIGTNLRKKAHTKGKLIVLADFLRLNSSGTLVSMDTRDYRIERKPGTWLACDDVIVDDKQFFLMQNEQMQNAAAYAVVDESGKLIVDAVQKFDEDTLRLIHEHLHPPQSVHQEEAKQPPMENWQKAFEGTSLLISVPAPMTKPFPIVTPSSIITLLPTSMPPSLLHLFWPNILMHSRFA